MWLFALQVALALVFVFGDIGFDHPGRFGLDFGHLVAIGLVFAVAWGIGVWRAVRTKAWSALTVQLLLPLLALPAGLIVAMPGPDPRFQSASYQHLVGKSEAEVEAEIGRPRGATLVTLEQDGVAVSRELVLVGMTIRYSQAGTVVAVEANEP